MTHLDVEHQPQYINICTLVYFVVDLPTSEVSISGPPLKSISTRLFTYDRAVWPPETKLDHQNCIHEADNTNCILQPNLSLQHQSMEKSTGVDRTTAKIRVVIRRAIG